MNTNQNLKKLTEKGAKVLWIEPEGNLLIHKKGKESLQTNTFIVSTPRKTFVNFGSGILSEAPVIEPNVAAVLKDGKVYVHDADKKFKKIDMSRGQQGHFLFYFMTDQKAEAVYMCPPMIEPLKIVVKKPKEEGSTDERFSLVVLCISLLFRHDKVNAEKLLEIINRVNKGDS